MVQLNSSKDCEGITIKLSDYPIAYNAKCEEYVEQGLAKDIEEAKSLLGDCEISIELYYEKHHGLFGVETDAIESHCDIYSPYSQEEAQPYMVCPICESAHIRRFHDCGDSANSSTTDGYLCKVCGHEGDAIEFYED